MFMGIVDYAPGPMLPPDTSSRKAQPTTNSPTYGVNSNTEIQRILHALAISLVGFILIPTTTCAATRTKQDNPTDLNLAGSWDTLPGAGDIAQWTSTVAAGNTTASLGADLNWAGIKIAGPGGAVTINSGNTLTLGTSGIANNNSWTLVDVTTKTYGGTFAVNGLTGAAGVWTKTDGSNIWTFTQATGKLGLTVSSYGSWATNQGLTGTAGDGSGVDPAVNADPNKDGVQNGMAWLLGAGALGNPAANLLKLPAVSRDGTGALVLILDRLASSAASAPLVVQYGDDLGATPWNNFTVVTSAGTTTDGNGSSIAVALGGGSTTDYDRITVTIPAGYMATHPKTFARLAANLTP